MEDLTEIFSLILISGNGNDYQLFFVYIIRTLSVAELKCNISVKNVLEADVLDSLLILAPRGAALGLGSEQHKIC